MLWLACQEIQYLVVQYTNISLPSNCVHHSGPKQHTTDIPGSPRLIVSALLHVEHAFAARSTAPQCLQLALSKRVVKSRLSFVAGTPPNSEAVRMSIPTPGVQPRSTPTMTTRRVPLANNTNAINSPFRNVAAVGGKRTRAQVADARELVYGQPPSKKVVIEIKDNDENTAPRTLTRQNPALQDQEAKVFMRKTSNAPPTAFEKKLAAARGKPIPQSRPLDRPVRAADNLENIRQWQKHYRKAFPGYTFYFESVPDDIRTRISRQIHYLGAVSTH